MTRHYYWRRRVFHLLVVGSACSACTSGLKQELARADTARQQLERERSSLEKRLEYLAVNLEDANRQIDALTSQLQDDRLEFHRDRSKYQAANSECVSKFEGCEARRILLETSAIGVVVNDLEECKEQLPEQRRVGFTEGRLELLQSLRIAGYTRADCVLGSFFCDYYYIFEVQAGGDTFGLLEIETVSRQADFLQTLSAVSGLWDAINILR